MGQIANVKYFFDYCNKILGTSYNYTSTQAINVEWLVKAVQKVYKDIHAPKPGCRLLLVSFNNPSKLAVDVILTNKVVAYLVNFNRKCDPDCACVATTCTNCNCNCVTHCECNTGTTGRCSSSSACNCNCRTCACKCGSNCDCAHYCNCNCGSPTECDCDCDEFWNCNCTSIWNCNRNCECNEACGANSKNCVCSGSNACDCDCWSDWSNDCSTCECSSGWDDGGSSWGDK